MSEGYFVKLVVEPLYPSTVTESTELVFAGKSTSEYKAKADCDNLQNALRAFLAATPPSSADSVLVPTGVAFESDAGLVFIPSHILATSIVTVSIAHEDDE